MYWYRTPFISKAFAPHSKGILYKVPILHHAIDSESVHGFLEFNPFRPDTVRSIDELVASKRHKASPSCTTAA